jgi:hypothetical protein
MRYTVVPSPFFSVSPCISEEVEEDKQRGQTAYFTTHTLTMTTTIKPTPTESQAPSLEWQ